MSRRSYYSDQPVCNFLGGSALRCIWCGAINWAHPDNDPSKKKSPPAVRNEPPKPSESA